MLNATLFGKVIGLANNVSVYMYLISNGYINYYKQNPYIDPNNANHKMDRYALRIADSTGMFL